MTPDLRQTPPPPGARTNAGRTFPAVRALRLVTFLVKFPFQPLNERVQKLSEETDARGLVF